MAEHLASIFGTEKDRVNCPFYFKIGACRHGDRCSRLHTKLSISPTLLLSNMYQRPDMITPGVDPQGQPLDPSKFRITLRFSAAVQIYGLVRVSRSDGDAVSLTCQCCSGGNELCWTLLSGATDAT